MDKVNSEWVSALFLPSLISLSRCANWTMLMYPLFLFFHSCRTAFAIGAINTPNFSLARLIGGLISLYISRRSITSPNSGRPSHLENITLIIVASGFVLGEGLASVVGLVVKSAGGGPISCWGCGLGGGGYCGGC